MLTLQEALKVVELTAMNLDLFIASETTIIVFVFLLQAIFQSQFLRLEYFFVKFFKKRKCNRTETNLIIYINISTRTFFLYPDVFQDKKIHFFIISPRVRNLEFFKKYLKDVLQVGASFGTVESRSILLTPS